MINKVGFTPVNYSVKNNRAVSFTGTYNTLCEDIDIDGENIKSQVKSISGDINAEDAILNKGASTVSGDIFVSSSRVKGDLTTTSGDIKVTENSIVSGNLTTTSGDIGVRTSTVRGNIDTTSGDISLKNANIDGVIKTYPENLNLKGNNSIRDLIIQDSRTNKFVSEHFKESGFGNIRIKNNFFNNVNSKIIINGVDITDTLKKKANSQLKNEKPLEFTLPSGNKVLNMLKFDTDKPGVLILEKGAELLGKLVNGKIKRI